MLFVPNVFDGNLEHLRIGVERARFYKEATTSSGYAATHNFLDLPGAGLDLSSSVKRLVAPRS